MGDNTTTILVGNVAETYSTFLKVNPSQKETFLLFGERAALWMGDHKVAVTSYPLVNIRYLQDVFSSGTLLNVFPSKLSNSLCADVMRDLDLQQRIVSACRGRDRVEIIPYGTTIEFIQLCEILSEQLTKSGVEVIFPESSMDKNAVWIWQYLDSKVGFRHLFGEWFGTKLAANIEMPKGFIAQSHGEAARIVQWFLSQGLNCICKSSIGVLGMGLSKFSYTASLLPFESIRDRLSLEFPPDYFPIIVEEMIASSRFPSVEAFVPRLGSGDIRITYVCDQLFSSSGQFNGVIIHNNLFTQDILERLNNATIEVGRRIQETGYVGIFDLDFLIETGSNSIFLLEANIRRTGGTHIHELVAQIIGKDYSNTHTILGINNLPAPGVGDWREVLERARPMLFPIDGINTGVLIWKYSSEPASIGYVLISKTTNDVNRMNQRFLRLMD